MGLEIDKCTKITTNCTVLSGCMVDTVQRSTQVDSLGFNFTQELLVSMINTPQITNNTDLIHIPYDKPHVNASSTYKASTIGISKW